MYLEDRNDRLNRVIARGEHTGHAHVITGDDVLIERESEQIKITVKGKAFIRHLKEKEWLNDGREVNTGEHADIELQEGTYLYVAQTMYDPITEEITKVRD